MAMQNSLALFSLCLCFPLNKRFSTKEDGSPATYAKTGNSSWRPIRDLRIAADEFDLKLPPGEHARWACRRSVRMQAYDYA
jgi:hypothetical protein